MTQSERILREFLCAPEYELSNRYLRRALGFNEANARITELNDEWREKGWDLRIMNTGKRDGAFSIHRLEGDLDLLGEKRYETKYEPVKDEAGRTVSWRRVRVLLNR